MTNEPSPKKVLMVTKDLFFPSKVSGPARSLNLAVDVAGTVAAAREKAAGNQYACVLIDLSNPGLDVGELLSVFGGGERPPCVAFGSHVHGAKLEAATAAGCDEVMPNSRFSANIAQILERYAQ